MKIVKYKKRSNGKYSVYLDDGREFIFYEEVILKYELLLKKEISDIDEINKANIEYDVYYVALSLLKSKMRSCSEVRNILIKREYPEELVDITIDKLKKQGYLNDYDYASGFIHYQINCTNHGPNRIKKELYDKGIDYKIINELLEEFDMSIQKDKIDKLINLKLKSNNNKNGNVLKNNICNYLINLGYDYSVVEECLNNYSFSVDKSIIKKEYDKLMRKYSSKYDGDLLKRKVREKLYLKGMIYEEE